METLASTVSAPANAEMAPVDAPEADAEGSATPGEGSAPSAPEASTPAPKKDSVQERIDKLTREKYDALRERDRNAYELERLREQAQKPAPAEQVAPATDFPTLEQFGFDEGKYQAAVVQHVAALAEKHGEAAAEKRLAAERERLQQENVGKSWATKEAEFSKSKPDYVEKVQRHPRDGGPVISKPMADLIMTSDIGPQVAYYLAENVEKSAAIAQLPPHEQAREIGRIEARLEAAKLPPKPLVSQAPPPVSKVETNDAVVEKSPTDMSDTEFAKWRRKQIAARRNN